MAVEPITLEFLARQQDRVLEELARTREDMALLVAMVQRLDGTVQGLVAEVRAEHARYNRLDRRVHTLESEESR